MQRVDNHKIFGAFQVLCFGLLLSLEGYSAAARAELKWLSDNELSDVTGQAFIRLDDYAHDNHRFTRVNLGLDVDIQTNIDSLQLGTYHRWEKHPTNPALNGTMCQTCNGTEVGLEKKASDIHIDNFSLGYIDKRTDEIHPFRILDPYLEFAFDENGDASGVRLGFGKAKGWLSGDILSLTGNLDISIEDTAAGLAYAGPNCSSGAYSCLLGYLLKGLGPVLLGDSKIQSDALLVNAQGQPDPIRGSMVGMLSGTPLTVDATGELNWFDKIAIDLMIALTPSRYQASRQGDIIQFYSSGCDILTIELCFPLSNFGSFEIGRGQEEGTEGFFMSAQKHDIRWAQTFDGNDRDKVTSDQLTGLGAFLNIPNNGVVVNIQEALKGIDRQRTEYVDRGRGLF